MGRNGKKSSAKGFDLSRRGFLGGAAATAASATWGFGALGTGVEPARAVSTSTLSGDARLQAAYEERIAGAERLLARGMPVQTPNGDEERYASRIGNYSKGLPHNALGEVDPTAYNVFLAALASGDPADFETIHLAGPRRLTNPQAGLAFDTEGADPQQFAQPPAPRLDSAETAGEMVEHYWQALLRDVSFSDYGSRPIVQAAVDDLNRLSDFRGPKVGGQVTAQTLFRDDLPGATEGPYISQFMLLGTPFGTEFIDRRSRTLRQGSDHGTSFPEWLAIQNGSVPGTARFDPVRRYLRNGRDLAEWVHIDVLFQAYFNACLILGTPPEPGNKPTRGGIGCPVNVANPYRGSLTQDGFATWGAPAFKTVLCEVATRALKAVWYQKWLVHRRLRPEAYAGRVHVVRRGLADYPLHADVLESEAVARVEQRYHSSLLPLAFPEGSPTHPSYGAGHATVAGACVTILKALFDETFVIPRPVVASGDGLKLRNYQGAPLTVGGELNKVASNVATGRNIAGVHWRTDAHWSLRLGEQVAIELLNDHKPCFNEGGGFRFTSFDGELIEM